MIDNTVVIIVVIVIVLLIFLIVLFAFWGNNSNNDNIDPISTKIDKIRGKNNPNKEFISLEESTFHSSIDKSESPKSIKSRRNHKRKSSRISSTSTPVDINFTEKSVDKSIENFSSVSDVSDRTDKSDKSQESITSFISDIFEQTTTKIAEMRSDFDACLSIREESESKSYSDCSSEKSTASNINDSWSYDRADSLISDVSESKESSFSKVEKTDCAELSESSKSSAFSEGCSKLSKSSSSEFSDHKKSDCSESSKSSSSEFSNKKSDYSQLSKSSSSEFSQHSNPQSKSSKSSGFTQSNKDSCNELSQTSNKSSSFSENCPIKQSITSESGFSAGFSDVSNQDDFSNVTEEDPSEVFSDFSEHSKYQSVGFADSNFPSRTKPTSEFTSQYDNSSSRTKPTSEFTSQYDNSSSRTKPTSKYSSLSNTNQTSDYNDLFDSKTNSTSTYDSSSKTNPTSKFTSSLSSKTNPTSEQNNNYNLLGEIRNNLLNCNYESLSKSIVKPPASLNNNSEFNKFSEFSTLISNSISEFSSLPSKSKPNDILDCLNNILNGKMSEDINPITKLIESQHELSSSFTNIVKAINPSVKTSEIIFSEEDTQKPVLTANDIIAQVMGIKVVESIDDESFSSMTLSEDFSDLSDCSDSSISSSISSFTKSDQSESYSSLSSESSKEISVKEEIKDIDCTNLGSIEDVYGNKIVEKNIEKPKPRLATKNIIRPPLKSSKLTLSDLF